MVVPANLIEQAVRKKLRFASVRGDLTIEQLFDLPLIAKTGCDLQTVATTCNKDLKDLGETDFVNVGSPTATTAQLKLDIVKHVIEVKREEMEATQSASARASKRQEILAIIDRKKAAELESKTPEELQAMLNAL